ncbi:HAD family phosphatase [Mycobacterium sp. ITM-2016-00317]|uniref:HAD family hydrolase n=1 Tax=Mycobacterium sp. ITM-2016-00317 TaxID=2099694 RepID=UPI00287FEB60|nr:HAD family phosphatase [Mycobacterium sp. ITM-2016-00317]WNG88061.1 HAD family phosphatase [Mycobacterium sp. ITM-2016-00317]
MLRHLDEFDVAAVRVILCDADGNLFPSEEPAFEASVGVTNRYLSQIGVTRRYTAEELRISSTGKNFRTTAVDLALEWGAELLTPAELERWVQQERREVTAHLGSVLQPDRGVLDPLALLSLKYELAAVSSSALGRLKACFTAATLDDLIPERSRFSAEDSLPVPTSKPDPAVYRFAIDALGITSAQAVAVEDSVPGVASAVAAGVPTIGNVMFVPADERERRCDELAAAGACILVDSWHDVATLLVGSLDSSAGAHRVEADPGVATAGERA